MDHSSIAALMMIVVDVGMVMSHLMVAMRASWEAGAVEEESARSEPFGQVVKALGPQPVSSLSWAQVKPSRVKSRNSLFLQSKMWVPHMKNKDNSLSLQLTFSGASAVVYEHTLDNSLFMISETTSFASSYSATF